MRILIILIIVITVEQNCLGQNVIDTSKTSPEINVSIQNDSSNSKQDIKPKEYIGRVRITVSPKKANDASLAIIRKTKFLYSKNSVETYPITPDTIGTWRAPLNISLDSGNYNIVAKKEGFKEELKEIGVINNKENNVNIEMFSLSYLEQKRSQWRTTKWTQCCSSSLGWYLSVLFS